MTAYGNDDAAEVFHLQLTDDLSDLVAEVVEHAAGWPDLPDKRSVQRGVVALAHARGAAGTRVALLRLAAICVAAAARIPTRQHNVRDEEREVRRLRKHPGGKTYMSST